MTSTRRLAWPLAKVLFLVDAVYFGTDRARGDAAGQHDGQLKNAAGAVGLSLFAA